jgi:hypothetical protein
MHFWHFTPLALVLVACHSAPDEPTTKETPAPRAPIVHVIVDKDHRNLVRLAEGDYLELPHDAAYVWSIRFENGSYFDKAPSSDTGIERYRASRTGIVETKVLGDPKICMHSDAPCTIAKYEWSVNVAVE